MGSSSLKVPDSGAMALQTAASQYFSQGPSQDLEEAEVRDRQEQELGR